MLCLRIELLTGRFVASEHNNRDRPEWPPHPARVFSALVASHHEAGATAPADAALRWLERCEAPQLSFCVASARDVKTHFVPVNDKALSDSKSIDKAWAKLRAATTDKQRGKAAAKLEQLYLAAGAESPTLAKKFRAAIDHVMPATRTKQPRSFPSVTPEHPVVHLSWPESSWAEAPSPVVRAGLDALARGLVRLGHSSSLVAACWTEVAPAPTLVPSTKGARVLRWVGPGQLDALEALHRSAPFAEQRAMPHVVARYTRPQPERVVVRSRFAADFIVMRRVDGPRLPIQASATICAAVRRALMSHAVDPVPALISGHQRGGGPLQDDHVAVAALPFVEGPYASGDLLGVAIIPPAGLELDSLRPLYAAIAGWEAASSPGPHPRCVLTLGRLGRWELERSLDLSPLHTLREHTWTRPSHDWASVTPVVLDRHPGSFVRERARAVARANQIIRAACRRIDLPEPVEIELGHAPFFKGSVDARQIPRRSGRGDPRPRMHVRLRFDVPVSGPVLLGAGRYHGLGLLRPRGVHD